LSAAPHPSGTSQLRGGIFRFAQIARASRRLCRLPGSFCLLLCAGRLIHRANRVAHTDEALYSYRMDNRDSITKAPFNPAHMQFFTVSDLVIKFLEKNYQQLCRYARLRRTNFAVSFFRRCAQSGAKGTHEERCLIRQVRKGLFPYLFSAYKPQAKAYGMLIAVCPPLARRLFAPQ